MDGFNDPNEERSAEIWSLIDMYSGTLTGIYRDDEVDQLRSEWE